MNHALQALTRRVEALERELAECRHVEAGLRASEERYRTLARNFPNGAVMLFDRDLRYTTADGAGLAEVGLSKETLETKTLWEIFPPEITQMLEPHYRAALDGTPGVFEVPFAGRVYLLHTLPVRDETGAIVAGMAMTQNVTGRRQADEALRVSEARKQALVSAIPDLMLRMSADGVYLDFHAERASDVVFPAQALVGMNIRDTGMAPELIDRVLAAIRAALASGQVQTLEYSLSLPAGARDYEARCVASGPDEVVVIVRDITERKRAETALRESEARFRSAFDDAAVGMALVAPDHRYLRVNDAYCRIVGYTQAELLATGFSAITHPDDVAADAERFGQLLAGAIAYYELPKRFIHKDGHVVWGQLSVSLVRDAHGRPLYSVSQVQDITERRQAEAQLAEREAQYRSVFEATSDGLFINDLNGNLVDFNASAAHMHGYTVEEFRRLQPAQFIDSESFPVFEDFLQTVRAGRVFRDRAVDVRKDGSRMPVEVLGTSFSLRGQPHTLAVVRDVTEQVRAYDVLEQRVEERTRELATLLHVSRHLTSTFELDPVLGEFLDHIRDVIAYESASIFSLEGDVLQARAYRGPLPEAQVLQMHHSARNPFDQQIIATRQPLILADLHADTPAAAEFRGWVGPEFAAVYAGIRSWMRAPLTAKERVIGMLTLYHAEPDYFSPRQAELALAFADQAAVAMENVRLFDAIQRRAEQFRVIGEMGYRIASILALDELLAQTVRLIRETFGYYHVHIGLIEEGRVIFPRGAGLWRDEGQCARCETYRLRVGQEGLSGRVAGSGEPILVADVSRDSRFIPTVPDQTGSALVLPLKVKGRVIGVLDIESEQPNAFDAGDMTVLQSFANQTAVAIENARLYEQSQQLAALEERQKLARELHDSVSQALYGIALGARTARTLLDRQPDRAAEPLDYVLSLSDAALAEMRALIFELRPESLEVEGLTAALEKQAASLRARHYFEVVTTLESEPDAPLEVKQALCRIAQEALHNVVKHAKASRVELRLQQTPEGLTLEVRDNGLGFDVSGSFPGHLGLRSMRERAERLGGALRLESRPGDGCRLHVLVPLRRPVQLPD